MPVGDDLPALSGYRFEVRYSPGAETRARATADLAEAADAYLGELLSPVVDPDIALLVLDRKHWFSRAPYGLPYFNDDPGQIRPGIVVMSAGPGEFWSEMVTELLSAVPRAAEGLAARYPDGRGGVDLQPFFDLMTVHEIAHAYETLGDLRLPTAWLSEIFVNLALRAIVVTRLSEQLPILETMPTLAAGSAELTDRVRRKGVSTLDELEINYTGGQRPMSPNNYVWYQNRWHRLAAAMFATDGEPGVRRFWDAFHASDRFLGPDRSAAALAPRLGSEVSATLGAAVASWDRTPAM